MLFSVKERIDIKDYSYRRLFRYYNILKKCVA